MAITLNVSRTHVELTCENNPKVILGSPAQKAAAVSLTPNRGLRGEKGERGSSGAGYIHDNPTPQDVWVVQHNLGFWPTVIVYDTNGDECEGSIMNQSVNQLTITFSAPFAGTVRLT